MRLNARFAIAAAEAGSSFVPLTEAQWRDVLATQEERTVAADSTEAWKAARLQIPAGQGTFDAHQGRGP